MLRPLPPDPKAQTKFLLALAILLVLLVLAAMGQDVYEADCDLPVDGTLRKKQAPSTVTPPTPERPPEPPPPPPPPEQTDEKQPTIYGTAILSESSSINYVIDISGSMALDYVMWLEPDGTWNGSNRLDRAKSELIRSISTLPGNWRFNIVAYDCDIRWWSPQGFLQATEVNKAWSTRWITALTPAGGTGTAAAVSAALAIDRKNMYIVLLTDGAPSCSEDNAWHRRTIKQNNTQGARIDVFGISCPANSVMHDFCVSVASDNNGCYTGVP